MNDTGAVLVGTAIGLAFGYLVQSMAGSAHVEHLNTHHTFCSKALVKAQKEASSGGGLGGILGSVLPIATKLIGI